jgi:hypothetical protein
MRRAVQTPSFLRAHDENRIRSWTSQANKHALGVRYNSTATPAATRRPKKSGFLARILPDMSLEPAKGGKRKLENEEDAEKDTTSSIRKLVELARPEKRQLGIAVGLVS